MYTLIRTVYSPCSIFQLPLESKIEIIAKEIYGADGIDILPEAQQRLALYKRQVKIYTARSGLIGVDPVFPVVHTIVDILKQLYYKCVLFVKTHCLHRVLTFSYNIFSA